MISVPLTQLKSIAVVTKAVVLLSLRHIKNIIKVDRWNISYS